MKLTELEQEFIDDMVDGLDTADTTCGGLDEINEFPFDDTVGKQFGWYEHQIYIKTKASLKRIIREMIKRAEERSRRNNRALAIATTIDSQSIAASALRAEGWKSSKKSNRKNMSNNRSPIQLWYKSLNN